MAASQSMVKQSALVTLLKESEKIGPLLSGPIYDHLISEGHGETLSGFFQAQQNARKELGT